MKAICHGNLFDLKGKVSLIVGGGRGIGRAIAEGYRRHGSRVAVFDRDFPHEFHNDIYTDIVDIGSLQLIEEGINRFYKEFKSVDILVNCAGITIPNKTHNYDYSDWQKTMDINLNSVFLVSKSIGNLMIEQGTGGSIINVTSIGAEQGFPSNPAYCSSKGGLKQLSKAMAYDWGSFGIRVNNLVPGYTNTPMNKKSWNDAKLKEDRSNSTFLNRWAEPEEMIGPAVFLASSASSYMTGSDLVVDGGWTAKGL